MFTKTDKNVNRKKIHAHVRLKVSGSSLVPRLNVYRSTTNIYAQIINDEKGETLVSASSLEKELASKIKGKSKQEIAKIVGELVGKRALAKKIKKVVFDRGGYLYTGRVKELADGARAAGLEF